jgi:hypothetical protein
VILCDLCGEQKQSVQKEIDGREFDLARTAGGASRRSCEARAELRRRAKPFSYRRKPLEPEGDAAGVAAEDFWWNSENELAGRFGPA